MARTTSRSLLLLPPAFLLTASIILTGAIPDRDGFAGRAEGDSVESGEEYPDFVPSATPASYSRKELTANVIYPSKAQEEGVEAKVYVAVYVDKTGMVEKVEVLKVTPDVGELRELFTRAAIEGVKKTSFTPAVQKGLAINSKIILLVDFVLE